LQYKGSLRQGNYMLIAIVVLLLLSVFFGYFAFRKQGPSAIEYVAKIAFFVVWSALTVMITLWVFKNTLKPTVEVKFDTKSFNEIIQKQ
jgi:hypothetical protein